MHRRKGAALEVQINAAKDFAEMIQVAYKMDVTVEMTVRAGNLRQTVLVRGRGPETVWLYNFAEGNRLSLQVEAQDLADEAGFPVGGFVPSRKRGLRIDPEGP